MPDDGEDSFLFGSDFSLTDSQSSNCSNTTPYFGNIYQQDIGETDPMLKTGKNFFAYFTPVILLVGLLGNGL